MWMAARSRKERLLGFAGSSRKRHSLRTMLRQVIRPGHDPSSSVNPKEVEGFADSDFRDLSRVFSVVPIPRCFAPRRRGFLCFRTVERDYTGGEKAFGLLLNGLF